MDDFLYRAKPWALTLVLHNWPIILYSAAALLAALLAYSRPTRSRLLLLYGLAVLALAFEYQKHGVPVLHGTIDYLFSEEANPAARRIFHLALTQALPWLLHVLGLTLLLAAALGGRRSVETTSAPDTRGAGAGKPVPPTEPRTS